MDVPVAPRERRVDKPPRADANYTTAIDTNLVRVVMASVYDIILTRCALCSARLLAPKLTSALALTGISTRLSSELCYPSRPAFIPTPRCALYR